MCVARIAESADQIVEERAKSAGLKADIVRQQVEGERHAVVHRHGVSTDGP